MKEAMISALSLALAAVLTLAGFAQSSEHQSSASASLLNQQCASTLHMTPDELSARQERASKERERLLAESASARTLLATQKINSNAVIEAGDSNDKSLVPYLKFRADVEGDPNANIALIRMGDDERLEYLIAQTRCIEGEFDEKDYSRQHYAIKQLGRVKTRAAIKAFYVLLDDTEAPKPTGHSFFLSRSEEAVGQLSRLVEAPHAELRRADGGIKPLEERLAIWKTWFMMHGLVD